MAFTSWADLRTAIKNALADHVAGSACTGEYTIGNRRLKYRSYDELLDLYKKTLEMEAIETMDSVNSGMWNKIKFARPA